MEAIVIRQPDVTTQDAKALTLLDKAKQVVVTSKPEYDAAVEFGRGLAALEAEIVAHYKPAKEAAHKAHAEMCAAEKVHLKPVQEAKSIVSKVCTAWKVAEDEKARRLADEARARAEAKAEKLRAEELKRREDDRLKQAAELAAAGKKAEADAVLEAPIHVPVMQFVSPLVEADTTTEGAALRGTWDVEVFDLAALVNAVAEGLAPIGCVQPDLKYLKARARADKNELRIAGVRAVLKQTTSFRKG